MAVLLYTQYYTPPKPMGLDQSLYKRKVVWDELNATTTEVTEEIAYWRKHNRLQGYMQDIYYERGQFPEDYEHTESLDEPITEDYGEFNCVRLYLDEDDLYNLEEAILNKQLPETQGFFFGNDSYEVDDEELEEQIKEDLEAVQKAKLAIKQGYEVYYSCWW